MDFGLNRWNTYELTAPDGWEADLDAGGMEDEWMRRCGALGAYGVGDRDGLAIARLDWRWVARGRLGGPVHAELRVYLLGDEDGRFDLRLTEGERAALDADIRDWLVGDGVFDASGNVIDDETLRGRYFELCNREDDEAVQKEWGRFSDDLWAYVDGMGLERQATWFIELNDPITIKGHYWVHDGVEYLDAAHTLPRFED